MTCKRFTKYLATGLSMLLVSMTAAALDTKQDDSEKARIETIVRDYIKANPEVIIESITDWQRQQQLAAMLPAIENYRQYLERDQRGPVLGNPDGDVTIVEFFDYRCGYCRRHYKEVKQLVKDDGNIRLILKQFPILDQDGQKPHSRLAAAASLAAHKQGKFEEMHHAMITTPKPVTEDKLLTLAARVGLDTLQLRTDMNNSQIQSTIDTSLYVGKDIGFSGTPSYVIGTEIFQGAVGYANMKRAVEKTRQKNKKTAQNQKSG